VFASKYIPLTSHILFLISNLSIRDFFLAQLQNNSSGLESRISNALLAVQLQTATNKISLDRLVGTFSGGQQARLLFASALILEPDVLLLGE
jgi:ABC-type multidrug transport system ATPase subunit